MVGVVWMTEMSVMYGLEALMAVLSKVCKQAGILLLIEITVYRLFCFSVGLHVVCVEVRLNSGSPLFRGKYMGVIDHIISE
jgi:hypothetical protein